MHKYSPWEHLLLGEACLVRRLNQTYKCDVTCIADLGLNQLKVADYQSMFQMSGLNVLELKTNIISHDSFKRKVSGQIITLLINFPLLESYITANIYAALEKPAGWLGLLSPTCTRDRVRYILAERIQQKSQGEILSYHRMK